MKIKVQKLSYDKVCSLKKWTHKQPCHQSVFFRWLLSLLAKGELKATNFKYELFNMDEIDANTPALYLMNHSSFTDLMITARLLKNKEYHIVCTNDGFIGKASLMYKLGCIPTRKFITDLALVRDMKYCVKELNSSILMFPEASYSFDGSETPLPSSLGKCVKMLNVPVVMIKTTGAFLRDPLYNNLQKRNTNVSATVSCIINKEDIEKLSAKEITEIINSNFKYDHFREQFETNTIIDEPFRADGLHRVLYKCPACGCEGKMIGKGTSISCASCHQAHELTPNGKLKCISSETTRFEFVTDWYKWERECVREELKTGQFSSDYNVDIYMLVNEKSIYKVGTGTLHHDINGFTLSGCDNQLNAKVASTSAYSLYADYFWYEIGDMICIGDNNYQYYCFSSDSDFIVAKERLLTEEIYGQLI